MPLTWQDVAGGVRASDPSGLDQMITRGIATIGDAVQQLGTAPEQRRQQELGQQMAILGMLQSQQAQHAATGAQLLGQLKADKKEKAIADFSTVQSQLEAGARQAALKGIPLDQYLANDKTYQSLNAEARAYGGEHLGNAWMKGDDTRISMAEHAADNARADRQFAASQALQRESLAIQRQDHLDAIAERRAARELAAAGKPTVWKTGNDKTDKAMTILGQSTGMDFNEASGAAYDGVSLSDLGKKYKNLGTASEIFDSINRDRRSKGLPALPDGVLKRVVDKGVGSNSPFPLGYGLDGVDDAAVTKTLLTAADQYDTALKGKQFYERLSARVNAGARPLQADVDRGWNMLFPQRSQPAAQPVAPPADPTTMDIWNVARR